jgi:hypothetical protein
MKKENIVNGSFFKCKSNDYTYYQKGKIYHKDSIGKFLIENPEDWFPVLDYPTSKDILQCIESGTNKAKIIKALKQWQNCR